MADYNLGTARGNIVLDYDGTGVDKAQSGISSVAGTVGKFAVGAVAAVGLVTGAVAGLALKGGLERALDIQDAQQKLIGLGHSAAEITEIMNDALSSVKGTAFGLGDAATVAASAVAAGIPAGQQLAQYLKDVADAATIGGVSLASMGQIFNKVTAAGKAYNGDLEQLAQEGIPIYEFLAKELGITTDAVFDLASSGGISSEIFRKAIEQNIGGAALSSGLTARGALDNVQAALSRLGVSFVSGAVTQAPSLFIAIEGAVDRLNTALAPVENIINEHIASAFAKLTVILNNIDWDKVIDKLHKLYDEIKNGNIGSVSGDFGKILAVADPIGKVLLAVGGAIGTIAGAVGKLLAAGIKLLGPIINDFANALNFLSDHPALLAAMLGTLAAAFLLVKTAEVLEIAVQALSLPIYAARTFAVILQAQSNNKLAAAIKGSLLVTKEETVATGLAGAAAQNASIQYLAERLGLLKKTVATEADTVAADFNAASRVGQAAATDALSVATLGLGEASAAATPEVVALAAAEDATGIGEIVLVIAIIIAAIGLFIAAIVELVNHVKPLKDAFQEVWDKIKEAFEKGADAIGRAVAKIQAVLGPFIKEFEDDFGKGIGLAIELVKRAFDDLETHLAPIWDRMKQPIKDFVKYMAEGAGLEIISAIEIIIGAFTGLYHATKDVYDFTKSAIEDVVKAYEELKTKAAPYIDILRGSWHVFKQEISPDIDALKDDAHNLRDTFGDIGTKLEPAKEAIKKALGELETAFDKILIAIGLKKAPVTPITPKPGGQVSPAAVDPNTIGARSLDGETSPAAAMTKGTPEAESTLQKFTDDVAGFFNKVATAIDIVVKLITAFVIMIEIVVDTVTGIINGIAAAIQFVAGIIEAVVNGIIGFFQLLALGISLQIQGIVQMFQGAATGITTAWNAVITFFNGLGATIAGFFVGADKWLLGIGKTIMDGLVKGIQNGITGLEKALKGIGDFIVQHKGPPSADAVMLTPAGGLIMDGLIRGIQAKKRELALSLGDISASIAPTFTGNLTPLDASTVQAVSNQQNVLNYHAAPNQSLDSEQDLFGAMRKAKVLVPGW